MTSMIWSPSTFSARLSIWDGTIRTSIEMWAALFSSLSSDLRVKSRYTQMYRLWVRCRFYVLYARLTMVWRLMWKFSQRKCLIGLWNSLRVKRGWCRLIHSLTRSSFRVERATWLFWWNVSRCPDQSRRKIKCAVHGPWRDSTRWLEHDLSNL